MKKLLILLLYVCSLVTSCYDDSFLNQRVDDLYDRVSTLEERCYQMNGLYIRPVRASSGN